MENYEPLKLNDIIGSGGGSFARQWILLSRRRAYVLGSGDNHLWMGVSGGAGHTALHAVDIYEGPRVSDEVGGGRKWKVSIMSESEARDEDNKIKEERKLLKESYKLDEDMLKIKNMLNKKKDGATLSKIINDAHIGKNAAESALGRMIKVGLAEEVKIFVNGREFKGYTLTELGMQWREEEQAT